MNTPIITVKNDYNDVFKRRVEAAIELNKQKNIEMVDNININSGPYRPYCMSYDKTSTGCNLDFYAASRVFGFEHSIEDIASAIAK